MTNDDPTTDRSQPAISDAVDALISEFTHRLQRGEGLTIDEFTERHPQFADELKRLLPTVRALAGLAQAGDPVPDSPLPTLGDFQLLREIGRGGMGVVYEAEQLSLGRRVALKVLPFAGVLDPRQLQRFRNEARAAATLDHPHIVHVHAVGQERGVHFYAMQLIDGRSLAEFVQEMQPSAASTAVMTPHPNRTRAADGTAPQQNASTLCSATAPGHYRQVARWGVEAAEALDYAHQMGIVHRDIKPSNLLINREGRLWVADFGLAMTRTDQGMTMTGDVLGTLRYMSPEQLRGHRSIIDQRTDIYSLGVTLYELLVLRPAFPDIQRADILRGRREDQLVPLRKIRRDIPVDLETIVLRALETDPSDRFETAQALADDLRRFLDDRPIVTRPPRWHETLMKWGRRHTGVLAAALVTTLFVVLVLTVSVVLVAQARRTALVSERERRMELASFEFERSLARCTPQDAATGLLWLTKSLERVRELGATELESGIRRQIAGWSQHVPVQKMVWSHEAPVLSVAFSSDGRTALSASQDGETCLWNVETGSLVCPPLKHPGKVSTAALSPAGDLIVTVGADRTVHRWNSLTGERLEPPLKHQSNIVDIAFSPDGRLLLTGCLNGTAQLWNTVSGKPVLELAQHPTTVRCVGFSPDGARIATGDNHGTARLWDAERGSLRHSLRLAKGVSIVVFSPDSRRLLVAGESQTAVIYDAETGESVGAPMQHEMKIDVAAFSPNGKLVVTGSPDRTARVWDAVTGQARHLPLMHLAAVKSAVFSPDSSFLMTASFDWKVRLWDVVTGQQLGSAMNCQTGINQAALSRDGRWVLTGDQAGFARVCDLSNLLPRLSEPFSEGTVGLMAMHPRQDLMVIANRAPAYLWDMKTWCAQGQPLDYAGVLRRAAFAPDGTKLLLCSDFADTVRLWDVETTEPLGDPLPLTDPSMDVAFAGNGRAIATVGFDRCAKVWDVATQKMVGKPMPHPNVVLSVAFSPDGATLVTGCTDHFARRWDLATNSVILPLLPHDDQVCSVSFSDDGRTIVTSGYDHTARLWDAETGLPRGEPYDHGDVGVVFARMTPDGKTLVTATGDNRVVFWNLETHHPVGPPHPSFPDHRSICLTPDGKQVLAGYRDDRMQSWDLPGTRMESVEQISHWATVVTGMELDATGTIRPIDRSTWLARGASTVSRPILQRGVHEQPSNHPP